MKAKAEVKIWAQSPDGSTMHHIGTATVPVTVNEDGESEVDLQPFMDGLDAVFGTGDDE